jgi:hypothetical protein
LLNFWSEMVNRWITAYAPLRETPGGRKLCDMPFGSLVTFTGETRPLVYAGLPTEWTEMIYQTGVKTFRGWTYGAFLEAYDPADHPQIIPIPHQTDTPQDAAQYMVWFNQVQWNLCGELCVCYVSHIDLIDLIAEWGVKAPSVFNRIFYGGRSQVTGIPDLNGMLSLYGYPMPSVTLADGLRDPILERPLITPARFESMLQLHQAIVSVKIETAFGRLKPSGIGHWIVVNNVYPRGINDAAVEIYNPFSNEMESYSWAEFNASMGAPLGLWVARR